MRLAKQHVYMSHASVDVAGDWARRCEIRQRLYFWGAATGSQTPKFKNCPINFHKLGMKFQDVANTYSRVLGNRDKSCVRSVTLSQ